MKKIIVLGAIGGFLAALLLIHPPLFAKLNPFNILRTAFIQKGSKLGKTDVSLKQPLPSPTAELSPKPDISSLGDTSASELIVDGQSYFFNEGKVTRKDGETPTDAEIAKVTQFVFFYQWTKEDPLFTAPDFDLENFKKSVEVLKYLEAEYNKVINRSEHFFPLLFLEKIPDVFEAEKKLFNQPSDTNARALISVYQETAAAYQQEAERFWQTIKANAEKIPNTNYISFNNTTTKQVIISDIEKLTKNGPALSEEIEKRKLCFEQGQNCQRATASYPQPQATELNKEDVQSPLPISTLFQLQTPSDLNGLGGPYIVPTSCFGWGSNFSPKPQLFYLLKQKSPKFKNTPFVQPSSLFIKLATDNFYLKAAKTGWFQDLNTDLPYISQREDASYLCRDLSYQARLSTLDYFWQNFRGKTLFGQISPAALSPENALLVENGKKFEDKFFSTTPPSWTNLEILASYYGSVYQVLSSTGSNQILKDNFLNRYLLITRSLNYLPLLIDKASSAFVTLISKERKNPGFTTGDNFFYPHVYLSRSAWNLLYFPFSSSFWRYPENLQYLEKREVQTISENGPYIDYQTAVAKFGQEEVKKMKQIIKDYINRDGIVF